MRNGSACVDPSQRPVRRAAGSRATAGRWLGATFDPLLRLLFPPVCVLCGDDLGSSPVEACLCGRCRNTLAASEHVCCPRCARPFPQAPRDVFATCPRCLRRPYRFRQTTAVGVYSGLLRDAVLRVKRSHQEPLTFALGRLLADRLRARSELGSIRTWSCPYLCTGHDVC